MEKGLLEKRKQVIYEFMCSDLYVPMKIKELAIIMSVPREEREALVQVLDALVLEGKIECSKCGKYSKTESKFLTGAFIGNTRGFGFVSVEGEEEDIFIPESQINGAIHGDTVQVALTPGKVEDGKRREGAIVKILQRGMTQLVGTFQKSKNFGFVIPDDGKLGQDIFIPIEHSKEIGRAHV